MLPVKTPHTQIVSVDVFKRVQELRDAAVKRFDARLRKTPNTGSFRKFLLSGAVVCSTCGGPMLVTQDNRGDRKMRCASRQERAGCTARDSYSMRVLERTAIRGLQEILTPDFEAEFLARLRAELDGEATRIADDRQRLTTRIQELRKEIDRAISKSFADDRVSERAQTLIGEKIDQLQQLQATYAQLPSPRSLPAYEDTALPTLAAALDDMWIRAPFMPENLEEQALRDTFQGMVQRVCVIKIGRSEYDLEIDYRVGGAFDLAATTTKRFRQLSHQDDPRARKAKRDATFALAEKAQFALSDDEFKRMSACTEIRAAFGDVDEATFRAICDSMVLCASADAMLGDALAAHGVTSKPLYGEILAFRQSPAVHIFKQLLAELRPNAEVALGKLEVRRRPSRYLRARLAKIDHPFLELSICKPSRAGDLRLTEDQWSVVLPNLRMLKYSRKYAETARSDLEAAAYLVRHDVSWAELPERFKSSGNIARRLEEIIRSGDFNSVTRALMEAEGLIEKGSRRRIPKIPEVNRRSR